MLNLYDGESYRTVALRGANEEFRKWAQERGAFKPGPDTLLARIAEEREPIQVPDIRESSAFRAGDVRVVKFAELAGARTYLYVPLLKEDAYLGGIAIYRPKVRAFTDKQVELVKTFAKQAVIAIENVRLFNETKESLEQQTATAEILKVISASPTATQPVFDAIVQSAARLFAPSNVVIVMREGDLLQRKARAGPGSQFDQAKLASIWPLPFDPERSMAARSIIERRVIEIPDTEAEGLPAVVKPLATAAGYRAITLVPLIREGEGIGVIAFNRPEPGFKMTEKQLALVRTFADQAVIAIENVRLFNETKDALERQTATAEILKVISSSPTDEKPVFDAIVASAARLFGRTARIRLLEDRKLILRAISDRSVPDASLDEPLALDRNSAGGRVALDRAALQVPDTRAPDAPASARSWGEKGVRAIAVAPLLRESTVLGVIYVSSREPGALAEKQMALLQTFADQAVIAIENVRLFKELQTRTEALTKSVGQLTALGEVGQAISSTLDLETVLKTIVARAVQLTGLDGGSIYEYDERAAEYHLRATENYSAEVVEVLRRAPIRRNEGPVWQAGLTGQPTQIAEMRDESYQTPRREFLLRTGYRALLVVPLMRENRIVGALAVTRKAPGAFAPEVVELLKTFATQSALAIQNARLFREIAEKGRQLEVASQHKSQFLASMSHELRTPLNALLGFNEMLLGDIYGEVPGDMRPPLAQMQSSGKHLLRLINNVLDLAKIEAGRMELALAEYSVHDTVESVRSTLQPLAADKGLDFRAAVPADIPLAYGDPGRITQCLMNLAGNSLKFTKAGKVEISVAMNDGLLRYRVADTGIGIPPDKIEGLFTEFKQTDATVASEYGGTGLGLSISKKFVEMHGGRIWAESEPGRGSVFTFEVPLRAKGAHERQDHPVRRGQRGEPHDRARPAEAHEVHAARGLRRRGGRGEGARGPAGPDPHGHPAAEDLRPGGDPAPARRGRDRGYADHRHHLVRAFRRRAEGEGRRRHRLPRQALQPFRPAQARAAVPARSMKRRTSIAESPERKPRCGRARHSASRRGRAEQGHHRHPAGHQQLPGDGSRCSTRSLSHASGSARGTSRRAVALRRCAAFRDSRRRRNAARSDAAWMRSEHPLPARGVEPDAAGGARAARGACAGCVRRSGNTARSMPRDVPGMARTRAPVLAVPLLRARRSCSASSRSGAREATAFTERSRSHWSKTSRRRR